MVDGPELLRSYIKSHDLKTADVAAALNASISAVHYWLKGGQKPRAEHREDLERWTNGAVPASSWREQEASAERTNVDAHPAREVGK
jgi:hypothetical protein